MWLRGDTETTSNACHTSGASKDTAASLSFASRQPRRKQEELSSCISAVVALWL